MALRDLLAMVMTLNPHIATSRSQLADHLAALGYRNRHGHPLSVNYIAQLQFGAATAERNVRIRRLRLCAARERGRHTRIEWEATCDAFMHRCVRCLRDAPLTKDHITPIYRDGSDAIANIQPLCLSCNAAKGPDMTDHRLTAPTIWTPARINALRTHLNESVEVFGARFQRSGRTVEDWEQGRRRPDPIVLIAMSTTAKRSKFKPLQDL